MAELKKFITEENLNKIFTDILNLLNTYNENFINPTFDERENESWERTYKRWEGIYDYYDKKFFVLESIINKESEIMKFFEMCKENKQSIKIYINEIVDKILQIKKQRCETEQHFDEYNILKIDLDKRRKETIDEQNRRKCEEMINDINKENKEEELRKRFEGIMDLDERKQLQEWTQKRCGKVIFNSDNDDWSDGTSVFAEKILYKSNLVFIVEDTENNKFGGYVTSTINECKKWIEDSNAFVFSLKSNGRLNGMKKFDIIETDVAFCVDAKQSEKKYLFSMGWGCDIQVDKKGMNKTECSQKSFNYQGNKNTLCGKDSEITHSHPKEL